MSQTRKQLVRRGFLLSAVLFLILAISGDLEAARLNVRVVKADGQPPGVVQVCFATVEDRIRQGSKNTGADGRTFFDISPSGGFANPLTVTVTANQTGFTGQQLSVPMAGVNKDVVLTLGTGSGGPRCPAQAVSVSIAVAAPTLDTGLRLVDFDICHPTAGCSTAIPVALNRGAALLRYDVDDAEGRVVTHYRIAASESGMTNAQWSSVPSGAAEQPIPHSFTVGNLGNNAERTLFFQVRVGQSASNIRSDSAFLRNDPNAPVAHEVRGDELKEMLRFAKQQGFTVMTVVQNDPDAGMSTPREEGLLNRLELDTSCAPASMMRISFLTGRALNSPWRIQTVTVDPTNDCSSSRHSATPQFAFFLGTPMVTLQHGTIDRTFQRPSATGSGSAPVASGLGCAYPVRKIILEGPSSGFSDPDKPWKDAFRR